MCEKMCEKKISTPPSFIFDVPIFYVTFPIVQPHKLHCDVIQGAPMNQRRVDFYLGAVGECLIAVGGRNDTGALSSVEVYYPAEDCWSYVAELPR